MRSSRKARRRSRIKKIRRGGATQRGGRSGGRLPSYSWDGTLERTTRAAILSGPRGGQGFVTISDPSVKQVTIAEKGNGTPSTTGLNYRLDQNMPNPFSQITTINFATAQEQPVSLVVYNQLGEVVATLVNNVMGAGEHSVPFNATGLSAGTYYYTLKAGSFVKTQPMTIGK